MHAAPTEGDDAGGPPDTLRTSRPIFELFLKIKVVDGRRDVEGLTRMAFHIVGHGAGLVTISRRCRMFRCNTGRW